MKYERVGGKAVTGVRAVTSHLLVGGNLISYSVVADSWIPSRKYLSGGLEWRWLDFEASEKITERICSLT